MWRVAADLDWNTIAQLSRAWANRHELTLAQDFVDHLDDLTDGETGRLLFEVAGTDAASTAMAAEFDEGLEGKMVLGVLAAARDPGTAPGTSPCLPDSVDRDARRPCRSRAATRRRRTGLLLASSRSRWAQEKASSIRRNSPIPWPKGSSTAWFVLR